MNIDELSPAYVGEDRIRLTLDPNTDPPTVGRVVTVIVDYSACDPQGVNLPIDFIVQGPSATSYRSKVLRRKRPTRLSFIPSESGSHLLLIREQTHNRWFGKLVLTVAGDFREV
jgi:hypothetical protein